MSDTAFFLAALGGGPNLARNSNGDLADGGRATGAMISGEELIIATVEQVRPDRFELIKECSIVLWLRDRSQRSIQKFAEDVRRWVATRHLDQLALRMGAFKGRVMQSQPAFKIEAALQLLAFVDVQVVDTQAVGNWIKREDPEFTDVSHPGRATAAKKLLHAMEMAAFAICHRGDARFFPENSDA